MTLLPVGFALNWLWRRQNRLLLFYPLLFLLLLWPAISIGNRFVEQDKSNYTFLDDYTRATLDQLPAQAVFFVYHDHVMTDPLIFGLAYQRYINNLRPDITIHSLNPVWLPPDDFSLSDMKKSGLKAEQYLKNYLANNFSVPENVYTSFPWPEGEENKNTSIGLSYKLASSGDQTAAAPKKIFIPNNLYLPASNDNFFHQALLAKYYYDYAANLFSRGKIKSGQWFLSQAINYDPATFSDYYKEIVNMRNNYLKND